MTDKEISRFKVKFPKVNLSKERLAGFKLSLAEDADDATIDAKLDEVNGNFSFEEIAKADDRARTPKPAPAPAPTSGNDPTPADQPTPPADAPEWAKGLLTSVKTLTETVATLQAEKIGGSRKSQVEKVLESVGETYRNGKLRDFDRMNFKDDEDFNAYLEGVKTDSAEFAQTETNNGLSKAGKPIVSTGGTQPKAATDKELDDAMSNFSI